MFLIPYNKLSDDQKSIIRRISREPSNLFVEGPPGSGKTLISLYTIKNIIENEVTQPLVLLYNHSLYGYLKTSIQELGISDNVTLATKDKFFWDLARQNGIMATGDNYEEKYNYLLNQLLDVNLNKKWGVAIIDEVQDLSKKEWLLIGRLVERITSMGDFNQGVYKTDLTRTDLTNISLVERLFDIFRFHKWIAKVADKFSRNHEGLEKKVSRIDSKHIKLIDVECYQEANEIKKIIPSLKNQRDRIGIICPSKKKLEEMHYKLVQLNVKHNFYVNNKDFRDHDFADTTPLLITSVSAKGLEFENVIVFGFDSDDGLVSRLKRNNELDEIIYVTLTRTNSGLYILRTPNSVEEIKELKQEEEEEISTISIDDIFG